MLFIYFESVWLSTGKATTLSFSSFTAQVGCIQNRSVALRFFMQPWRGRSAEMSRSLARKPTMAVTSEQISLSPIPPLPARCATMRSMASSTTESSTEASTRSLSAAGVSSNHHGSSRS